MFNFTTISSSTDHGECNTVLLLLRLLAIVPHIADGDGDFIIKRGIELVSIGRGGRLLIRD